MAVGPKPQPEQPRVRDHAAPFEDVGDLRHAGIWADQDGVRGLQRARTFESLLAEKEAQPPTTTTSTTSDMRKFMNTTNWFRDWRERLGGGVPAWGLSASLADLGTSRRGCSRGACEPSFS